MPRKPVQKRTLETRARLMAVARDLVAQNGYEALRVEEVVLGAGVAKGTFFAHFRDKDALMEILLGERLDAILSQIAERPRPGNVAELVATLHPLHSFMVSERYVFDTIMRFSGAFAIAEIGPIAHAVERYDKVVVTCLSGETYRKDISVELMAEGVMAFAFQAMSLQFCALHHAQNFDVRLEEYLEAWLNPAT